MLYDLIKVNRSYRRFHESEKIERETLLELVELARLTPSAMNLQPLKYILTTEPELNQKVFETLTWARNLKDWPGPVPGERPAAYIIVLGDTRLTNNFGCDYGITSQTIMLGAVEKGLGGCMLASIDRERLRTSLDIPEYFEILLVLALGRPAEKVVIEPVGPDGDISYYRDKEGIHHVPKRALDDIIVG